MKNYSYIVSKKTMKHGVYVLMNEYGVVEYVGRTKNGKNRIGHHKKPSGGFPKRKDLQLVIVKEFDNVTDANLYEGELKLALGFEWTENSARIESGNKVGNIVAQNNIKLYGNRVSVYHKDTNEFIGTFESIGECARSLNIQQPNISACLNNRLTHTAGYTFSRSIEPERQV